MFVISSDESTLFSCENMSYVGVWKGGLLQLTIWRRYTLLPL